MNDDDNNVAELAFGAEFDFDAPSLKEDLKCLTNDQVYFLLDKQLRRQVQFGSATTETFDQTYTFIEKVATTRRVDDIGTLVSELSVQLRELELEKKGASGKMDKLHQFEVAMLANLIKAEETSIEEAIGWIPSLIRFEDDDIAKAVDLVVQAKQKVVNVSS